MVARQRGDCADNPRSEWIEQVFRELRSRFPPRCCPDAFIAAYRLKLRGWSLREIARAQRTAHSTASRRIQRVDRLLKDYAKGSD